MTPLRSKNHPTCFPRAVLVPAAFVPDPHNLEISLALKGKVMQKGHTGELIFNIPKLASYISSLIALRRGDMIITCSRQGNGSRWGRFLRDGDVMESTVTGLGTQRIEVRCPLPH